MTTEENKGHSFKTSVCSGPKVGIGLQYGHCYTMKDTSQRKIQRVNLAYAMGGTVLGFKGLVFRICKSTQDCWLNIHEYVPLNGAWYQLDQLGDTGKQALKFNGTAVTIFGECAICLRLADQAYLNWMGTANSPLDNGLTLTPNPVSCRQFYYQETSCLTEVGAVWNT
ncbi:hypothetical protein MMC29_000064 [Sticta canariensis]|nr:hypothetical protein [Sticta canariensis]